MEHFFLIDFSQRGIVIFAKAQWFESKLKKLWGVKKDSHEWVYTCEEYGFPYDRKEQKV